MQLSPHFALREFTRSTTAARLGIDNTPSRDLLASLRHTASVLERIRAHLGQLAGREVPIHITSGYRCPALNAAIGGARRSDHLTGCAVDFEAPDFGSPTRVAQALAGHLSALSIGQLINEFPDRDGWVHVSTQVPDVAVNRVITITARGTVPGIVEKV